MSGKREVRAWRLTPVFDPQPGQLCNAGTTHCLATGEYLLGTSVGEALSPKIVRELRKTHTARVICDGDLIDAACEFLRVTNVVGLAKVRVNGRMLSAADIADRLSGKTTE